MSTPSGPRALRPSTWQARAALIAASALSLALANVTFQPTVSHADDASTLTVVGTSDVFDSNLVQEVLKPGFEAYEEARGKDVTLNYLSQGTGAAITTAEQGTASALLVHAASLENQFVDQGYSYEPYGRAIFYGDYVLLGPPSDPAGVLANDPHDIVGAFEDIAAAGATGDADFVSRGGTPGTTVQEHAIWALTSGVTTCTVSDTSGGGTSPSTGTGPCASPIALPDWYHATGVTQAPNILNADACNGYGSDDANDCYVLTDRGTYNYLRSQLQATHLNILVRDNDAASPGGDTLLINSFHAYAINPAKFAGNPNVQLNVAAATDFLNWVTSPAGQAAVGRYLDDGGDPPFLPDAQPRLTVTSDPLPASVNGGQSITVSGALGNVVPGTPALSGETVSLKAAPIAGGKAKVVASTTTDDNGHYSITYKPTASATYTVASDEIFKIENSVLNPPFGDMLAPASKKLGSTKVNSAITITKTTVDKAAVTFKGTLKPEASAGAFIRLYGAQGKPLKADLPFIARRPVKSGTTHYSVTFHLGRGYAYRVRLQYTNTGVIQPGSSDVTRVRVP